MDQDYNKNKEKVKYIDNNPSFLADSVCLSAFGSKLNVDPKTIPIKSIIKRFDDSNVDYVQKLDTIQNDLQSYYVNCTNIGKNLEKAIKEKEKNRDDQFEEVDIICELNRKSKQFIGLDRLISKNEVRSDLIKDADQRIKQQQLYLKNQKLEKLRRKVKQDFDYEKIVEYKGFPKKPLQHRMAETFFKDVKSNRIERVSQTIKEEPNLVYEYDNNEQIALHWAAKRNYTEILLMLIQAKSDINQRDLLGRTPLFHAVSNDSRETARLLLGHGADSFLVPNVNIKIKNQTTDYMIKSYLTKAQKISIKMGFLPIYKKQDYWKRNYDILYQR